MSQNDSGDEQDRSRDREPQLGLSLSGEDTERRPSGDGSRRSAGTQAGLRQAVQVNKSAVERWFLPFVALIGLMFILAVVLYLFQGNRLTTLERQVAALDEQDSGAELDRMRERMENFGERTDDIDDLKSEVQALRTALSGQISRIEALTGRLDKLEKATATSPGSGSPAANGSSTQASTQSGDGAWVINLITVGDRVSAETFQERLEKLGATSRIDPVTVEDKTLLRVVVPGFKSRQAAENAGADLKSQLKLSDNPWITRQ